MDQFSRTEMIFGKEAMEKLAHSRVAIFGIGGVGGNVVEALARSGVGTFDLIDDDRVCLTNLNRQIIATHKTIGQYKVDAAEERILDINPKAVVNKYKCFFLPDTAAQFDFSQYDYVIDAIDTVTGKLEIIMRAQAVGTPVISSMGTGNKVDPTMLRIADIYQTKTCPLARIMRLELRKRGVDKLKVLYSEELPLKLYENEETNCAQHCICPPGTARKCTRRRDIPASNAFVPPTAGLLIASQVLRDLVGFDPKQHRK